MSIKPIPAADLFKLFESHISRADTISARLLSKISLIISKKRLELGLNQKEFAQKLGVSQAMVSKWESENYNYSVEALASICEKLDFDMDIKIEDRDAAYHYQMKPDDSWGLDRSKLADSIKINKPVNLKLMECA